MRGNPQPASATSVAQTPLQVKPMLPLLAVLPAGVCLSRHGLLLLKQCPACGGQIAVENTPEAVAWIAARHRVCRECDEDMRANTLAWMPA